MSNYNSIADFNTALANAKTALPTAMLPLVRLSSNHLATWIKTRVSTTGTTSQGNSFSPYSDKYKKTKTKNCTAPLGKKIDRKNFYFSGALWNSFQVANIENRGLQISARIDFLGNNVFKSNRELNWIHSENEFGSENNGGIAYPTAEEEQKLVTEIELALFLALEKLL